MLSPTVSATYLNVLRWLEEEFVMQEAQLSPLCF